MPPLKSKPAAATQATAPTTTAPAPAKKGPVDMSSHFRTSDEAELEGAVIVHGTPGAGKTFFAASASEFFPDDMNDLGQGKIRDLEDMLWISVDDGATAGFKAAKIRVRELDLRALMGEKGVPTALDMVRKLVSTQKFKYVVLDTISQLDKYLGGYYAQIHADNPNTFSLYRDILARHRRLHQDLSLLEGQKIYLAHSKALMEASQATADQKNRAKAAAMAGADAIQVDITGQARNLYLASASLVVYLAATVAPGTGKREIKRIAYPYGGAGFEGKTRHQHILEYQEEPHLRHIFEKIQRG